MEKETNFGKAYKFAVDFLADRVWYFYVFPRYFLLLVKNNDSDIYLDMLNDSAKEKTQDQGYLNRLETLVDIYQNEVEDLRKKSDILSIIFDAEDPLQFFQEMMGEKNLNAFISLSIEKVKELEEKLKNKSITLTEIKGEINLKI